MERLAVFCRDKSYVLNTFAASRQSCFKLEFFVDEMDYFDRSTWTLVEKNLAVGYGAKFDAVLVVEDNDAFNDRILAVLHKANVLNIYMVTPSYIARKLPFLDAQGMKNSSYHHITSWDKPFIPHLETHVTDYCNLNCKTCSHYSPFFHKGADASFEEFRADLSRLKDLFSQVGTLRLLGGEPLLEPLLATAFMQEARRQLPETEIHLATNGLLIPRMEENFWNCVYNNHIIVYVTQYKPTTAMLNSIEKTLLFWNIDYVISPPLKYFIKKTTITPYENAEEQALRCDLGAGCHYFRNGKMTKCPDASLVKAFDTAEGTSIYAGDEIDIYAQKDGYSLLERLTAPSKSCASCAMDRVEYVPWEVCGKEPDKNDWLVDDRVTYLQKRVIQFLEEQVRTLFPHLKEDKFVCFGGGEGYNRLKRRLSKFVTVAYVCSNDTKEDHPREDGTQEITVAHLQAMDNPAVLITVDKPEFRRQIETQLTEMGITRYMVADDFLSAIEK